MSPVRLTNRYFLVRAGESEFESLGIINTNPVAKTSVGNGLLNIRKRQTVKAALRWKEMGASENSCWIWPSITQRAYQAAEIIAAINEVNRRRLFFLARFLSDSAGIFTVPSILSHFRTNSPCDSAGILYRSTSRLLCRRIHYQPPLLGINVLKDAFVQFQGVAASTWNLAVNNTTTTIGESKCMVQFEVS
ncbi:hypothetical protein L2E82_10381 [Cichorium intybus]|uniref:Uncharacterized protein n=1 Tax=Cichorium intybus TaxID=13427 RepID=A0ACB9GBE3_CICIN|nr:hypothetical protein L2E82_10381 [Cichorium intybus]